MTVYTELLRQRLADEPDLPDRPLDTLMADLLVRRTRLGRQARSSGPRRRHATGTRPDPAGSVAAAIGYDAALVRLCQRQAVPQQLLDRFPPPDAREAAEHALAERFRAVRP